jgi:hypothetical protein
MFSKAQQRAQDLADASTTCIECGTPVLEQDALWTASGAPTCSEACRDHVDGPEE